MTARDPEFSAEAAFDALKKRRLTVLDLDAADLNPDRGQFEDYVKSCVEEAELSASPDRYRDLWKSLFVEADRRFSWRPPEVVARKVAQSSPSDPLVRRATRVIAMVHELHKAGYQRIRMLPFLAPSGCYWRCAITYGENIEDDGYRIREEDYENGLVAAYTTGAGNQYFGWKGAETLTARQLAERFLREFPIIAERGMGRDWMYAGWVTDVLGRAEQGRQEDLLYLIADWDLDREILRDWQPPPPLRG